MQENRRDPKLSDYSIRAGHRPTHSLLPSLVDIMIFHDPLYSVTLLNASGCNDLQAFHHE
jgi:hypothetical protein